MNPNRRPTALIVGVSARMIGRFVRCDRGRLVRFATAAILATLLVAPASGQAPQPTEAEVEVDVASGGGHPELLDATSLAERLRDLGRRIDELKEQIFRSRSRLSLLAETVLQGVVAGAQAVIVHENRMGSSYRLVKAVYALDGARIFFQADEQGALDGRCELTIHEGSIVPGEHLLTVNLEYQGHGYGIFSYLRGYRFRVRSSHAFSAPEGGLITLRAIAYERGGPLVPLEERPAIRYAERIDSARRSLERPPEPQAQ